MGLRGRCECAAHRPVLYACCMVEVEGPGSIESTQDRAQEGHDLVDGGELPPRQSEAWWTGRDDPSSIPVRNHDRLLPAPRCHRYMASTQIHGPTSRTWPSLWHMESALALRHSAQVNPFHVPTKGIFRSVWEAGVQPLALDPQLLLRVPIPQQQPERTACRLGKVRLRVAARRHSGTGPG